MRFLVLIGEIHECFLASRHLSKERGITVYCPPGHHRENGTTVVYLADGEWTPDFARFIEPAIRSGRLPPLLLVGVHSGWTPEQSSKHVDLRGAEYLEMQHDRRFVAHESFFVEEVLPWAEHTWGASKIRDRRVVFGCSNGAAFALCMLLKHPDDFRNAVAFSVAGGPPERVGLDHQRVYLLIGTLEGGLKMNNITRLWADHLSAAGSAVFYRTRVAGHDRLMWREELSEALAWILR